MTSAGRGWTGLVLFVLFSYNYINYSETVGMNLGGEGGIRS